MAVIVQSEADLSAFAFTSCLPGIRLMESKGAGRPPGV